MSWGMLLSIATIAASMVTKNNHQGSNERTATTTALTADSSTFSPTFVSGICLGMGIQLFLASCFQQFRIFERFRLYLTKTWEHKQDAPWRVPRNLLQPEKTTSVEKNGGSNSGHTLSSATRSDNYTFKNHCLFQSTHGSVRLLVSAPQAATSSLQMTVITLRPGGEMPTARAASLEVYQVLSGSGHVSQQGVTTTCCVVTGQLWVVDPGSLRWINNPHTSLTDLVLLRTVDAQATVYNQTNSPLNRITQDAAHRTMSVLEQVSASVRQYGKMACDYYNYNYNSSNNNKQPTSDKTSSS